MSIEIVRNSHNDYTVIVYLPEGYQIRKHYSGFAGGARDRAEAYARKMLRSMHGATFTGLEH